MNPRKEPEYRVLHGPEGLLPPAAASMGIPLPEKGEGLLEGRIVPDDRVFEEAARKLLTRQNPTLFPGPMVLWAWTDHTAEKAEAVYEIANEIPGCRIIPMPDYRPIYPKIDPEAVINPCHPNLTIWHNRIEACIFVGVHCHFANITLKMVRAGTNCWTIALCAEAGHEDAMASVPRCGVEELYKMRDALRKVKQEGLTPLYQGLGILPSGWAQRQALAGQFAAPKPLSEEEMVEAGVVPEFGHELEKGLDENEE